MASIAAPVRIFESMIDPMILAGSHLPHHQRRLSVKVCSWAALYRLFEASLFDCQFALCIIRAEPVVRAEPAVVKKHHPRGNRNIADCCRPDTPLASLAECVGKTTDIKPYARFVAQRH